MTRRLVGTAVAVVVALLGVLAAADTLAGGTGDPGDRASVGLAAPGPGTRGRPRGGSRRRPFERPR